MTGHRAMRLQVMAGRAWLGADRDKAMKRTAILLLLTIGLAGTFIGYRYGRSVWHPAYLRIRGRRTVADALEEYGRPAGPRLRRHFGEAGLAYPPGRVALLIFKAERRLELWAESGDTWIRIRDYPVLAASGKPGPKLREGDRQVPEGIYKIIALNPNSSYHLSMKLNYPNAFDSHKAREEGRTNLGGDIFIHGKAASIGCVAVGNSAIEELFALAARVGPGEVKVIIAPNDMRQAPPMKQGQSHPPWVEELYGTLRRELREFRAVGST